MFGQQRAPFGSTSTFGAGFGTPSTTTSTTAFGFGRPAFGAQVASHQPQTQTSTFGTTTTPFGSSTSAGTSLFGSQPQQASGGLFGQQTTQATTGFGSTSGGGLFGQTQQPSTGGLFGSSGGTTGFGMQQSTQSRPFGFGQTTTSSTSTAGGLFGSQPAAGGGLFGTSGGFGATGTPAVSGTTVKYEPVTGSDTMTKNGVSTNIRTRIEVISAMKEYESKSLEELRVEDYLANRKGPGQGVTLPGFGQTQPTATQPQMGTTGGLFSGTSSSLFGTKPPENKPLFGAATTTGFGAPATGGLFGTSTSTPAFGQTSTTSTGGGFSFAQSTQQPKTTGFTFGNPASTTPSLFGTTTQPQQSFGLGGFQLGGQNTQQQTAGGLFGNQNKPGGFLPTQSANGGLFGNKPIQPLAGTGFGTSATVTPFGTTPSTSTGGGLFSNQNNPNKTGIFGFGNTTGFGSTGLFGQNNNQQKPGGLNFTSFGNTNPMGTTLGTNPAGSLFSTGATNTTMGLSGATGLFNTNAGFGMPQGGGLSGGGGSLFPDLGKLVKAMTEKPVFNIPLSDRTAAKKGEGGGGSAGGDVGSKLSSLNQKPAYVLSPSLVANSKPRPKPLNKNTSQGNNRHWLFKGLDDPNEESSEDFLKPKKYPSVRKLNLKPFKGVKTEVGSLGSSSVQVNGAGEEPHAPSPLTTPVSPLGDTTPLRSSESSPTPDIIKGRINMKKFNLPLKDDQVNDTLADLNVNHMKGATQEGEPVEEEEEEDQEGEANKENNNNLTFFNSSGEDTLPPESRVMEQPHPAGIKLTRAGYYTLPGLRDLGEMVDGEGKCLVENFTVGRYGYGNVCFLGQTDIAGLDLDAAVFILRKQVEVYPEGSQKPSQGQELNKAAVITLDCVWPIDKTTREVIKSAERLECMGWAEYLERQCVKMDAGFIEYRPETGSWVFKVKHFSKYGLQEDNEEEEMVVVPPKPPQQQPPQTSVASGGVAVVPAAPRSSGPPVSQLVSPAMVFPASPAHSNKQSSQLRPLDAPLQDSHTLDEDIMDSTFAREPEESASLSVLSPSAERLTVVSRVVPRQVQLAKAQLFGGLDQEEEAAVPSTPALHQPLAWTKKVMMSDGGRAASPAPSDTPQPRVVLQPRQASPAPPPSEGPDSGEGLRDPRTEYRILPSGRDLDRETGYAPPQHQTALVPLAESLLAGRHAHLADYSAFMGRSFRVGWGSGWRLAHIGAPLAPASAPVQARDADEDGSVSGPAVKPSQPLSFLFTGSLAAQPKITPSVEGPSYSVTVEQLHTIQPAPFTISPLIEHCLESALEHSVWGDEADQEEMMREDKDEPRCPFLRPAKGVDLLHQLAVAADHHMGQDSTISDIFNLCVALWGYLDFFSPESDGESEYRAARARVEAVSRWLESVSEGTVQEAVYGALAGDRGEEGYLTALFAHLTIRQVSQACLLAQDKGDHHLALLMSQACCGQEAPRQFLAQQLTNWAEGGSDTFMCPARLALYALLAGAPTHQASHTTVNTCLGLDWRRAFALHLWYVCPATCTLAEALQEYEQAAGLGKGDAAHSYCEPPLPPYLATNAPANLEPGSLDICYHLLKLYTDPMHQLHTLLNPATLTPDPLDVSISWLVWLVLQSLNYHHLSPQHQASLHLSMAALLESAAHWHWAVFVLLNISSEDRRSSEVKALLQRHVVVGEEERDPQYAAREQFVVHRLGVPHTWIYHAKAIKARSLNMVDEEAWFLLQAGEYNRAHTLIIDTIAPTAIINEDHQYLSGYLEKLSQEGVQGRVTEWAVGGGVYADYLEVCTLVADMKKSADPTPAVLEQLRPRLLSLCSRLNNLKCSTATHRLCVSEMSRVVVGVLRAVVGEGSDSATQVLSQQVAQLPLTHDYALAELNLVTTHYLTHLTDQAS